ncbi:hypothetical protein KO500_13550 [Cellulophaga baltica]|uniref:hypothetical protein n=1 Tax=Cellulophaga TaxID=104264 RepID=UPI001C068D8F|nr:MULTISPECIES: hypothetical protein [Cellulophaga]MBU2997468.1 hypothetical protein [Cellulophaga baltica]MDO6768865.1 hypothetical protein [Cellulophaga sp. 1_MG-2023]
MQNKLFFIFILILFSCKEKNKKLQKQFYDNGNLEYEFTIIDDSLKHGIYKSYYKSGELKHIGNYVKGNVQDSLIEFYKNGKIKGKGIIKNGYKFGWWLHYNQKGVLAGKSEFLLHESKFLKNQSIIYNNNGSINDSLSYYFKINIPDTIPLGKSLGKLELYKSLIKSEKLYIWVIIDNEYKDNIIVKDSFSDGSLKPKFGIFSSKVGLKKVKGEVYEVAFTKEKDSMNEFMNIDKKFFEKIVYVKDTI